MGTVTPEEKKKKYSFLYRNSLTIVLLIFFIGSWVGQAIFGFREHNEFLTEHKQPEIPFSAYLKTGHFIQATFENWESEFLQMGIFVVLTIFLRQQGSSESKPVDEEDEVDKEPHSSPNAPWAVRKGGIWLALYKHSLSIALFAMFLVSFVAHYAGSWKDYQQEQTLDGAPMMDMGEFLLSPKFWFESFQNWQSEFLSVACIVFLSIYLRQKGSSQSKPVDTPHHETK